MAYAANGSAGEPAGRHQTKKATASGWIGSALEYYDFFIYATAASLVFPQLFFPSADPTVAIVASLATYGVGYVARPIGAFVLGHLGDTPRAQERAAGLHVHDGAFDDGRRPAADLGDGRHLGADPVGRAPADPGLRGGRRDRGVELHDPRARAVRAPRLLRQLHATGRAGRADPGRRRVPAAGGLHADGRVQLLWLAHSVPAQRGRHHRRLHHPQGGRRDAGVRRRGTGRRGRPGADPGSVPAVVGRHAPRRVYGADEHGPGCRDRLRRGLCSATGLRDRLREVRVSVDPGAWEHSRRAGDPVRRQLIRTRSAAGPRSSWGHSGRGCSRSAISTRSASTACRWRSSCPC